jgi:hypothetical protein
MTALMRILLMLVFCLFQTITCDCEATPAFQLKAFSQKGEKVEVSHYRVNVNK